MTSRPRPRRLIPVALAAGVSLVVAAWAGLGRLGLDVGPAPTAIHGPLMVLGFLGTVIALERAVGLNRSWAWLAPLISAGSALLLLVGLVRPGAVMTTLAGAILAAIYGAAMSISGRQPHLVVMGMGALSWMVAGIGLAVGISVPSTAPALAGFLVLTICGERLELSRLGRPRSQWWRRLLVTAAAAFVVGAITSLADLEVGSRLTGLAMVVLAITSLVGDVAHRTVRTRGVTRYMAAALLAGYAWLIGVGVVWAGGGLAPGTVSYDVALHALFIGFVLSMIFGHAPVIVPAVAHIDLPYHPSWWGALALLHVSLAVRVAGSAVGPAALRTWGGAANVLAMALFILLAASSALRARRPSPSVAAT